MKSDLHITTCICHHTLVGDDYTATTVVVTFMSGDGPGATLNVSIPIVDDSLVEGQVPESFIVELVVGGSSDNGTVRIFDNDGKCHNAALHIYVVYYRCNVYKSCLHYDPA